MNYGATNFNFHYYFLAASFVYNLIKLIGMDRMLKCYKLLSRKKSLQENLQIFAQIVGSSFCEIETSWINHLE
jgi:hypothetical protein